MSLVKMVRSESEPDVFIQAPMRTYTQEEVDLCISLFRSSLNDAINEKEVQSKIVKPENEFAMQQQEQEKNGSQIVGCNASSFRENGNSLRAGPQKLEINFEKLNSVQQWLIIDKEEIRINNPPLKDGWEWIDNVQIKLEISKAFDIPFHEMFEDKSIRDDSKDYTILKETGNVIEIKSFLHKPFISPVKRQGADFYIYDDETGEVKCTGDKGDYLNTNTFEVFKENAENKMQVSRSSLYRTFSAIKDIYRCNCEKDKTLLIVLTYDQKLITRNERGIQNKKEVYEDFHKFVKRFDYYLKTQLGIDHWEYIDVVEPQRKGVFHHHFTVFFDNRAPWIPKEKLAQLWGKGFVFIDFLEQDVDDYGAYYCAYLTDIELDEALELPKELKEDAFGPDWYMKKIAVEVDSKKGKKSVIKGGRMWMYDAGMDIYRCSRGIKRPRVMSGTRGDVLECVDAYKNNVTYDGKRDVIDKKTGRSINTIHRTVYKKSIRQSRKRNK